jgi:hypothetical protein
VGSNLLFSAVGWEISDYLTHYLYRYRYRYRYRSQPSSLRSWPHISIKLPTELGPLSQLFVTHLQPRLRRPYRLVALIRDWKSVFDL